MKVLIECKAISKGIVLSLYNFAFLPNFNLFNIYIYRKLILHYIDSGTKSLRYGPNALYTKKPPNYINNTNYNLGPKY